MDFDTFIKRIEEVEKNVDKVLKAARLERHERHPMSKEMLAMILNYAVGSIAMIMGFALAFVIVLCMAGVLR